MTKKNIRKISFNIISILNVLVPKNKKKIFFYDSTFRKDNLWALCKHMSENNYDDNYELIYFTKKKLDVDKDTSIYGVKFVSNSIVGLYHHLTAKNIFTAFGAYGFMSKSYNRQNVINLWHGSPLKSIGQLVSANPWYNYNSVFSFTVCGSDFFKQIFQECFGFTSEKGIVFGAPRNDFLFADNNNLEKLQVDKKMYKKIILWMPTFRVSKENKYYDSSNEFPLIKEDNIEYLNEVLKSNKVLLIIKPHPFQEDISVLNREISNVLVLRNQQLNIKKIELYELLGEVDVLLTDYSSVYYDFLLTQKPIGFVLDDIHEYRDKRGFVVENPLELMPGEKIYNEEEFVGFIKNTCNGIDNYKDERKRINDLANKYQDNKNCERILDFLGIALEK